MKRFTKIMVIIASIMAGIGVACMIVAFMLGLTQETIRNMIEDDKFVFKINNSDINHMKNNESTTEIDEECENMDIEIGAGELEIYYDAVEKIQIEQHNLLNFEVDIKDGTLYVTGDTNSNSDTNLKIIIPEGKKFDEIKLEIGASSADIKDLSVDKMDIEVGAGEANITNLDVETLNADTGVGKLSIEVIGKESDYNYNVECGIGEIQIGENTYGGFGTKQKINNPEADKQINVNCGIGEVKIIFM